MFEPVYVFDLILNQGVYKYRIADMAEIQAIVAQAIAQAAIEGRIQKYYFRKADRFLYLSTSRNAIDLLKRNLRYVIATVEQNNPQVAQALQLQGQAQAQPQHLHVENLNAMVVQAQQLQNDNLALLLERGPEIDEMEQDGIAMQQEAEEILAAGQELDQNAKRIQGKNVSSIIKACLKRIATFLVGGLLAVGFVIALIAHAFAQK